MNYEEEMAGWEAGAEEVFDDYAGQGFEGGDWMETESYDYLPVQPQYDNYRQSSIGRIDPNDRTYTVVIRNQSSIEETAIVFGGNEMADQPRGITVEVEESSHREVREESKSNPFKIVGMKMSVSDPLQFDNVLKIVRKTGSGMYSERVYQPRNATSPQNFSPNLIDDHTFEMDVTGQDSLRLGINANSKVVFTFTVKARANMANLLRGQNVAEMSQAPRTTGLPQLDLIQQQQPGAFGLQPVKKTRRLVRRNPAPRPNPNSGGFKLTKRNHVRR